MLLTSDARCHLAARRRALERLRERIEGRAPARVDDDLLRRLHELITAESGRMQALAGDELSPDQSDCREVHS